MADPRIAKFASTLVHYSLELKPGDKFAIFSNPLAEELLIEVYAEALRAGANAYLVLDLPQSWEYFYKYASEAQLDVPSPIFQLIMETFDARLNVNAEHNTRSLTGSDPLKMARRQKAYAPVWKTFFDRSARGELRWCSTLYPTNASAQEAEMSLEDYREFVFAACRLNDPDPVSSWRQEGERQHVLQGWLHGRDRVRLQGSDIDLTLSITGRRFEVSDGKYNFPDGEIFTGPVENSANGWVRFRYPVLYGGQEMQNVELWFEDGQVVKERASKGQEKLTAILNTDAGARYLGEWGIGVNYDIPHFTKDMLFDEKLGGTIHFAVGSSYPETGGVNESGIHWDMLCDMHQAEITVDGELFYRDGRPILWNNA